MAQTTTARGTQVSHPEHIAIAASVGRGRRPPSANEDRFVLVREGVGRADFSVFDTFEMTASAPDRARSAAASANFAEVDVPIEAGEEAVLIVDRAGVFVWTFAEPAGVAGRRAAASSTARFRVEGPARPQSAERPARFGPAGEWLVDSIAEGVRVWVLKFAAQTVAAAADLVEKDTLERLVRLDASDPAHWVAVDPFVSRALGRPRPAARTTMGGRRPSSPDSVHRRGKVLLFLHGTFSSTQGSFASIASHDTGRAFLARTALAYDAVLGYDHKTLSVGALDNARGLAAELGALELPPNTEIDFVCYSRGGLVYRAFEEGGYAAALGLKIGKVVFVGCTLGGTKLAEPDRWKQFVNLYTNLAAFSAPNMDAVTEIVRSVGRFVQYMVTVAIGERVVPGIADMDPHGPLVRSFQLAPVDARVGAREYLAVRSNFSSAVPRARKRLGPALFAYLAEHVADRFVGEANDLVVNTMAMTALGAHSTLLKETFDVDPRVGVHHLGYFAEPTVSMRLAGWLGFDLPQDSAMDLAPTTLVTTYVMKRPSSHPSPAEGVQVSKILEVGADDDLRVASIAVDWSDEAAPITTRNPVLQDLVLDDDEFAAPSEPPPASDIPGPPTEAVIESGIAWPAPPAVPRSEPPVPETPREPQRSIDLRCHVYAEMPSRPTLGNVVQLRVTIAHEDLYRITGPVLHPASPGRTVEEDILVVVRPRDNCKLAGADRQSVAAPKRHEPIDLAFEVEGLHEGGAELVVSARQGETNLLSLVLQPSFVAAAQTLEASGKMSSAEIEAPHFELRIDEEQVFDRFRVRFALECPELGISETHVGDDIESTREAYVADIHRRLENLSAQGDFHRCIDHLRDLGAELYERLVPRPIREILWKHRDALGSIEVSSADPLIPWEIVHLVEPGGDVEEDRTRFLGEFGLVRWISNVPRAPARLALRTDRSWYVIPDYPDPGWRPSGAKEERAFLEQRFGARAAPVESEALLELMQRGCDVDLLHFACQSVASHQAIYNAGLMLTGKVVEGRYVPDPLKVGQIKRAADLWRADGVRPIVFLNAPHTERLGHLPSGIGAIAEAFLRGGAGLLVATTWSGGAPACSFSRELYERLGSGEALSHAVRSARAACKANQEPTWLAHCVYGHAFARLDLRQAQQQSIPASESVVPIPA